MNLPASLDAAAANHQRKPPVLHKDVAAMPRAHALVLFMF